MILRCLIIDDEPLSQDVLKDYVQDCPELELAGICSNALAAGNFLRKEEVDLLFLDINMPLLSGIKFIRGVVNPPLFIFITAYSEFAIEGFEVDAVDYLLKPVSFERFRKAINRTIDRMENLKKPIVNELNHIMVRADKKDYRVNFNDLVYLEAMGDYVRFYLNDNKLMVHITLKEVLSQLPELMFVRIHKSYVINIKKINYIEGNIIKIGSATLPVSLTYKELLQDKLNRR